MIKWEPMGRRVFVFSVPERRKFDGSSLFRHKDTAGSLSRTEDIWILKASQKCRSEWKAGARYLISDGFELEPTRFDFWGEVGDREEFKGLREFAEKCDGTVVCQLVHEDSILGEVLPDGAEDGATTEEHRNERV